MIMVIIIIIIIIIGYVGMDVCASGERLWELLHSFLVFLWLPVWDFKFLLQLHFRLWLWPFDCM